MFRADNQLTIFIQTEAYYHSLKSSMFRADNHLTIFIQTEAYYHSLKSSMFRVTTISQYSFKQKRITTV